MTAYEEYGEAVARAESAEVAQAEEEKYPEGGMQAWLVVFGAACSNASGFGLLECSGVFLNYLEQNQLNGYSPDQIGWIFSLAAFLTFFSGVQIGPIFDRYGPRWLMFGGAVCILVTTFVSAQCTTYWQFMLTFGLLYGIGTGLLFTPPLAAVGHFFSRRRGFATGIAICGGSVGGVVYPIILSTTLPKYGWAWSMRLLGFIFILLMICANVFVRSRLRPPPGKTAAMDIKAFKDIRFTLVTTAIFLCEFGILIPIAYYPSYAVSQGISPAMSSYILSIMNGASLFGRFVPGFFADKLGHYNSLIVLMGLTGILTFGLWWPASNSLPLIILYAIAFGFGSGAGISVSPVAIGDICKTEEYGAKTGTAYAVCSIGDLMGLPIAGALIGLWGGSYGGVIIFTGVIFLASAFFFAATRVLIAGYSLRAIA